MNLSTKQKQYLKGLAHNLKPVVLMGVSSIWLNAMSFVG